MLYSLCLAAVLALVARAPSAAQTNTNRAGVARSAPPPAYSVGGAYDVKRSCLVVFGGMRPRAGYAGATWEWDERGWREVAAPGPSPRNSPAMAHDEARGVTVLFGGDDRAGAKRDTWEWDGREWSEVADPEVSPPARTNARLAYDATRKRVVLFGGFAGNTVLGDTWEWDGASWTSVDAGGPPRFLHGFAVADGVRVTVGGCATPPSSAPPPPNDETWIATEKTWQRWSGAGPGARDHVALAYDPSRKRTVLYGGFEAGPKPSTQTWEWDGKAWTSVAARVVPGSRAYPVLVYDAARSSVLLFGGFDEGGPKNELWQWDGKEWSRVDG
jgi:hypothetical protein